MLPFYINRKVACSLFCTLSISFIPSSQLVLSGMLRQPASSCRFTELLQARKQNQMREGKKRAWCIHLFFTVFSKETQKFLQR